eukprot:TRINITY_DN20161_c0_g1_i2.p1 TRINITY_DN20161_c0_g1~~TRINITY_DN20161_c0_g1_i2.p1  ORF type:complete len:367 (+),score=67.34 TRINITY_DN20161_c0_g1_i2:243-1343(+)
MQDLVLLNADGDVESLAVALGLGNATRRKRNLRCSALFKLLPNNSDLVFGHTTWDHFTMMGPRMLKSYDYGNPGGKVTMSSSPAFLSSIDDFYLTSNQLAVIETTNGNFNDRLWDVLSTRSALSWLRVSVANLLAESIHEWGALFAVNNSGTYCDQWMVFDMKKFAPGRALLPGSFLVLEQLPGHIHSQDMSAKLQRDSFWSSYNIPYFSDIYHLSGFQHQLPREAYSHSECPRARIFAEQQASVRSVDGLRRVIRYNNWKVDPLSRDDPCNAISARCDLNPPTSRAYDLEGGLDAKVSSFRMAQGQNGSLNFLAQLGPTRDQQPVFDWSNFEPSKKYSKAPSHAGQPELFDFRWTSFSSEPTKLN